MLKGERGLPLLKSCGPQGIAGHRRAERVLTDVGGGAALVQLNTEIEHLLQARVGHGQEFLLKDRLERADEVQPYRFALVRVREDLR